MPLLTATGAVADHICANCGVESHITTAEWVTAEGDESVISTPPCACGSTESFSWHNWVYLSRPRRPQDLDPDEPFDTSPRPDHTHVGAQQMVLIERVAQALGRKKRMIPERGNRRYQGSPTAPTQASVRAMTARLRGKA
jgi:hypothetical protein